MAVLTAVTQPGYTTTTTTTPKALRATIYTEQVSGAQRSLSSSSASDAAAGTGSRKVRITYYDSTLATKKFEDVTLNGTTAVNTTNTDICFIESMVVLDVGSGGGNIGVISLFVSTAGGGGTIGTIDVGDNQTNWCHHYVPSGTTACVVSVQAGNKGASAGSITIRSVSLSSPAVAELVIAPQMRVPAGGSNAQAYNTAPLAVAGPARITLYAQQDAASGSNTWYAGFGYYEN